MRVLVTGANGHIGSNVVRELLEREHTPVAFLRPGSDRRALAGLDLEEREGDVLDPSSLERAMHDCELVIHAGAPYRTWARDEDEILAPVVQGTENVFRAAKAAGLKKVVYTSSCNAVGFTEDPAQPRDEESWNEQPQSIYIRAKNLAERRARELSEELDVPMVAILPTGVIGPLDYRVTPTTQMIADIFNGKMPLFMSVSLVHVRDVARAHALAAEKDTPRDRYLAGGDNVSPERLAEIVEKIAGKRPKIGAPPRWLLMTVAGLGEMGARVTGKAPAVTRAVIRESWGRHPVFGNGRAREDLGLEPRGAEETLEEAARWMSFRGLLSNGVARRYPPDPAWAPV